MRKTSEFYISNLNEFRKKLVCWAATFPYAAVLDSNNEICKEPGYEPYSSFDMLVGVSGKKQIFNLEALKVPVNDWLFGHISYHAFHDQFNLTKNIINLDGFRDNCFFIPDWVVEVKGNKAVVHCLPGYSVDFLKHELENLNTEKVNSPENKRFTLCYQPQNEYVETIQKIRKHIHRGDIYEMNYCIDFYAVKFELDPLSVWFQLTDYSPAPFSCFYRNGDAYLLSASPERYLKKMGNKLISQPIKGTIARSDNKKIDEQNKKALQENTKELSENIMITDLVRNDLASISEINSVQVEKLCELFSFKHVHQLISTISSKPQPGKSIFEIIKNSFPMGSMTGAPKRSAISIASKFETFSRGIYSGSVGYITPDNDFDFNVVIRSILYNAETKRVSLPAGSAVTFDSVPENEYNECLLKITPLAKILQLKL